MEKFALGTANVLFSTHKLVVPRDGSDSITELIRRSKRQGPLLAK